MTSSHADTDDSASYQSEALISARVGHRDPSGSRNRQLHLSLGTGYQPIAADVYVVAEPRFPESLYFVVCALFVLIGLISFAVMRCCAGCCRATSTNDDVIAISDSGAQSSSKPCRNNVAAGSGQSPRSGRVDHRSKVLFEPLVQSSPSIRNNTVTSENSMTIAILDDGTERQVATGCAKSPSRAAFVVNYASASTDADAQNEAKDSLTGTTSVPLMQSSASPRQQNTPPTGDNVSERHPVARRIQSSSTAVVAPGGARPKLFQLLIAIVLLSSVALSGLLSDVLAHANYPAGSWTFIFGAAGCDLVSAAACIVAARATARSEMSTVIAMSCLGSIVLIYFGALIAFGQHVGVARGATGLRGMTENFGGTVDTALLMGSTGEYLAVSNQPVAWWQ